jgi:hypothetical protein
MLSVVDRALDDPGPEPEDSRLVGDMLDVDHTWTRLRKPERHIKNNELRIIDWDCGRNCVSVPLKPGARLAARLGSAWPCQRCRGGVLA